MEIWDIYDKDRTKTGKQIERGSNFESGQYHIVIRVCIFNSKGEMLIQQRQPFKESYPGMWDFTVAGSALSGETSCMAAEREVFEEIGFRMDFGNIRPALTLHNETALEDVYLLQKDLDIAALNLQKEEVLQVEWATSDEILAMIDNGSFIPFHESFLRLLFDIRLRPIKTPWSVQSNATQNLGTE